MMYKSIDQALDNAKRHGLSTSEILEGYRRERAPILPYPFNDLNTDGVDNESGTGFAYTVACIEVGCVDCRETFGSFRYDANWHRRTVSLECPNCMEPVAEWSEQ